MRFHLFLHHIHNNIDPDLKAFIAWKNRYCTSGKFPQSSDPAVLALFLMDKLNPQQALGYKKAMILYFEYDQKKLPKKYLDKQAFIEMLNIL